MSIHVRLWQLHALRNVARLSLSQRILYVAVLTVPGVGLYVSMQNSVVFHRRQTGYTALAMNCDSQV